MNYRDTEYQENEQSENSNDSNGSHKSINPQEINKKTNKSRKSDTPPKNRNKFKIVQNNKNIEITKETHSENINNIDFKGKE